MKFTFLTRSPGQTKKLAKDLAKKILKTGLKKKKALILGLKGDLGGGKTTFLQGFARGLGVKEKILSPSFIIMRKFKSRLDWCSNSGKFTSFYHIDCYRIKREKEILDLGFKEIIQNPKNIVAIEWADKVRKILPRETIILEFDFIDQKTRKIKIKNLPSSFNLC